MRKITIISIIFIAIVLITMISCNRNDLITPEIEPSSTPSISTPPVFSKTITAFIAKKDDNKFLDYDLVWSIYYDKLILSLSYLFDLSNLEKCTATIYFSDGTIEKKEMNFTVDTQHFLVIDNNGVEKEYEIITKLITFNLPVFYIEIENDAEVINREKYLNATIKIDNSGCKYASFKNLKETPIQIRGRGHYSWTHPKKPYKIRFEEKTSVLGMKASKNWVLLANYVDRSLIQNYVAMEMGKVMEHIPYHTNQYPVDVFVNGTYRGVYTFGEQIEAKIERLNLEQGSTNKDTDYLIELGGADNGDVLGKDYFNSVLLRDLKIKHPNKTDITSQQKSFILSYLSKADTAVKTLSDYENYIDIDSLIDWVILHELTYNLDCCFKRSCFIIKEKGGKLKMGPIWDFDLAFGSFYRYKKDQWASVGTEGGYVPITWMNYLINDEAFMTKFATRWNEKKDELLNTAFACIDLMAPLVLPSAEYNFFVWDLLGKDMTSQPVSHKKYDTYEKMTGRLRSFIHVRYKWIDDQLN